MNKGVEFLGIASKIFKVLAWISAVFFIIVFFIVLFGMGGVDTPRFASVIFLLGGGIYFLILYSVAEMIKILVSMSEKVNLLANLLQGKSNS